MEKTEQELIIHHAAENTKQAIVLMPIVGITALFGFILIKNMLGNNILGIILQLIFGGTAFLFFIVSISALFYLNSKKPLAIINNNGIWLEYYGLIPWTEIRVIRTYRYKSSPVEMLAIYLYNTKRVSNQASFRGKTIIFWSKITGVPPVTISNTELPYATIIEFAKQFMRKES